MWAGVHEEIAFCLFSNLKSIIYWGTAIHILEYLPVVNKSTILIKKLKNFVNSVFLKKLTKGNFAKTNNCPKSDNFFRRNV